MIAHPDTNMDKEKLSFGKQLSRFLLKFFWHLNQQPAPIYSFTNRKCFTSLSLSKKSSKKHGSFSRCRTSPIERKYIRSQYPARYRTCSIHYRTLTLTSIQEE